MPPRKIIPIIVVAATLIFYFATTQSHKTEIATPQNTVEQIQKINTTANPYIKEYSLPPGTAPNAILPDGDNVWVVGSKLIKFDAKNGQIANTYKIGNSENLMSWAILKDNDGFVWFSRLGESSLWRFDPKSEELTSVPTSASAYSMKLDKKTGQIWFATLDGGTVGVVQKNKVSEFGIGDGSTVSSLFVNGNTLLVSELVSKDSFGKISKFSIIRDKDQIVTDIVKSGQIPSAIYDPTDVTMLDDTIWFTEHGSGMFARYDEDSGQVQRFRTSDNSYHTSTLPLWLRPNGDGFWFNEHGGNRIGFFDVSGYMTEYEIPSKPTDGIVVFPLNIAVDPTDQNKAWFSEWNTDKIALVDGSVQAPFGIDIAKHKISRGSNNILVTNSGKDQMLLVNATSSDDSIRVVLSENLVHLKSTDESTTLQFAVTNPTLEPKNCTITISVTDRIVTKSAFAIYGPDYSMADLRPPNQ